MGTSSVLSHVCALYKLHMCVSVRVLSHLHPNATGPDIITIYYAYTLYDTRARSLSPKKMRQAVNNMCSSAGTSWSEQPNSDHDLSTVICTNASARRRRHRSIGRWRVCAFDGCKYLRIRTIVSVAVSLPVGAEAAVHVVHNNDPQLHSISPATKTPSATETKETRLAKLYRVNCAPILGAPKAQSSPRPRLAGHR